MLLTLMVKKDLPVSREDVYRYFYFKYQLMIMNYQLNKVFAGKPGRSLQYFYCYGMC